MSKEGKCPKCKIERKLTKHHIYPRTHFRINEAEYICRTCHDELEYFIVLVEGRNSNGLRNKLKASVYPLIYQIFINT